MTSQGKAQVGNGRTAPRARDLRLLVLTDAERYGERRVLECWQRVAETARPGSVAIDVRERSLSTRALLAFAERLASVARARGQLVVINERLDFARLLGADGVHLGEAALETARARELVPEAFVVRACHRPEQVAAVDAEIVLLSPILAERKGNPPLGLKGLARAAAQLGAAMQRTSLFALGGIDAQNAQGCLLAGAVGVAAISSIFEVDDSAALLLALDVARD